RVDGPVPADREQPAAEVFLTAGEPGQVADHLQPRLAGDVLRVVAGDDAQEPQQRRLQGPPEPQKTGLVACGRPGQGFVQLTGLTRHRAIKGRTTAGMPPTRRRTPDT